MNVSEGGPAGTRAVCVCLSVTQLVPEPGVRHPAGTKTRCVCVSVFWCERDILLVPEPEVRGFLLGLSAEQAGITD